MTQCEGYLKKLRVPYFELGFIGPRKSNKKIIFWMNKKLSLAILLSGNGTNFQAIVDSIDNGQLKAVIKVVISNNKDAFGLKRARNHNIKNLCIDHKDFADRESYDQKLMETIEHENVDFFVLAGFMWILGSNFIINFKNKIINIHPSLLPKYPGLNIQKSSWKQR